jgi:hypothetical protein
MKLPQLIKGDCGHYAQDVQQVGYTVDGMGREVPVFLCANCRKEQGFDKPSHRPQVTK